ncbi:hypothetical protein [Nocardia abscessus]|nr:hypothetical protein [Nocardia abscessus]
MNDDRVEGYVHPRPLVEAIVGGLLRDPSGFLEEAFGRPMSP